MVYDPCLITGKKDATLGTHRNTAMHELTIKKNIFKIQGVVIYTATTEHWKEQHRIKQTLKQTDKHRECTWIKRAE